MFRGHHRKVRILFGISDVLLIGAAFELAYLSRQRLALEHQFFLAPAVVALLFGWSAVVWVGLGLWWELYDRMESAHPRVILRDVFRQCLVGAASVVLLEYLRPFGPQPNLRGVVRGLRLGAAVPVPIERRAHCGRCCAASSDPRIT